jgi:ABC-type Fe3+-hydroxamate transport system substrate-binding protein
MSQAVQQIKDHTGNFIFLNAPPQRIISLVPSQTELLYALGLDEQVVGITKFCVHPEEWYKCKTWVGGTKNINPNRIHSLKPDLIIANKEENVKEQVESLRKDYPVFTTDVKDLNDALSMIRDIGIITFKHKKALSICADIQKAFSTLPDNYVRKRVLYLIWKDPFMAAGGDTFISDMLRRSGLINVLQDQIRYPSLSTDDIKSLEPDIILLSSEPFPFTNKHIHELKMVCPYAEIILADGTFFSWYGSRLQYAPDYFSSLLCLTEQHEKNHP